MSDANPAEPPAWPGLADQGALSQRFHAARFLGAGADGIFVSAKRRDGGGDAELRFVAERVHSKALLERWSRYRLVKHPNVVALEQRERAGHDWCLVMAPTPPRNLEQSELPWTGEAGLRLLQQLASALASAHDVGLWHGGLLPSSVWLDDEQRPRIEFSGVVVAGGVLARSASGPSWQDKDIYDDIRDLALLAHQLFGGGAAAARELHWLARLEQDDALLRPSARDISDLLQQELASGRDRAARLILQTLDTERPPAPLRPPRAPRYATGPALPTLAATNPGEQQRVGRFLLQSLLGEGGMGSVYRAVDVASGQVVALKLLKPELLGDDAVQYRFRKEARVLKAVQSPYVANLIEAELNAEVGYIALEFVDGHDLATLLTERKAPLEETLALQIVADLCRALVEPHRRGIVHRDVKPQNVLVVGELGQPSALSIKLCDFGIASARLSSETLGMTQDGRLWGTPQYMSPEQCTSAAITPATDIYALGLTLYELIAGRPTFDGEEILALLRQHMYEAPKDLRECASVSDATAALVARALDKAPECRFADAAELLGEIERILGGSTALAAVDPSQGGRIFTIRFSVELTSSPLELWPFVSDTARMNEIVGLPPVTVERVRAEGSLQTFLSNRVLGIDMRWQEHPFEWVEGRSWSVLRECTHGVTRWYRIRLELEALPTGGTRLVYSMEFEPVLAILALVVKFEVGVKQKAKLTRVFRRVDALIRGGTAPRDPSPHAEPRGVDPKLGRVVQDKLAALRAQRVDETILRVLEQHVLHAPDVDIARIRPLRFARVHGLDERAVTEAFLLGTRHGLFDMLWDVICPLCQIPATFAESLERLGTHSDCPACELSFPLDFASSVELVFRVAPEVRPNEVRSYCIGGPAHSPHVAAQLTLDPGEGRVLALELSDGRHRIRSPQLPGVIELDVSARHAFSHADLVIGQRLVVVAAGPAASHDLRLDLHAPDPSVGLSGGRQTLRLRNTLERDVTVRVERLAGRDDALSAARVWSMPRFREWFPGETLESGRLVAVGQLSFLVLRVMDHLALIERRGDALALTETLRVFDELHAVAERHDGRLQSSTMDRAVAAFERQEDAVAAALALTRALARPEFVPSSLALHRGAAVATTIDARMEYYGKTLAEALELSRSSTPRQLVASSAALGDALERLSSITGMSASVRPAPQLGPAEWCACVDMLAPRPPLRTAAA